MRSYPPQYGFTLIELLVVISIISVLAGMLIPAITTVMERARRTESGNNQRQIVMAIMSYAGDYGTAPLASIAGIDPVAGVATPAEAATVTYRTFELLADTMSLPNKLFRDRSSPLTGPTSRPDALAANDAWGRGKIAYAYDWAAPTESISARVLIANRSSEDHRDVVIAACGDGHVVSLKSGTTVLTAGNGTTEGARRSTENPESLGTDNRSGTNADAAAVDDIYTDAHDNLDGSNGGGYVAGSGSARRALVK